MSLHEKRKELVREFLREKEALRRARAEATAMALAVQASSAAAGGGLPYGAGGMGGGSALALSPRAASPRRLLQPTFANMVPMGFAGQRPVPAGHFGMPAGPAPLSPRGPPSPRALRPVPTRTLVPREMSL